MSELTRTAAEYEQYWTDYFVHLEDLLGTIESEKYDLPEFLTQAKKTTAIQCRDGIIFRFDLGNAFEYTIENSAKTVLRAFVDMTTSPAGRLDVSGEEKDLFLNIGRLGLKDETSGEIVWQSDFERLIVAKGTGLMGMTLTQAGLMANADIEEARRPN